MLGVKLCDLQGSKAMNLSASGRVSEVLAYLFSSYINILFNLHVTKLKIKLTISFILPCCPVSGSCKESIHSWFMVFLTTTSLVKAITEG